MVERNKPCISSTHEVPDNSKCAVNDIPSNTFCNDPMKRCASGSKKLLIVDAEDQKGLIAIDWSAQSLRAARIIELEQF